MTQDNPNGQPLAFGSAMLKAASMMNVHPAFMQGAIEKTEHLANALRIGLSSGAVRPKWKPLLEITIGGGTRAALLEQLQTKGYMMPVLQSPEFRVASIPHKVKLVVVAPEDLGFEDGRVKTQEFFARAGQFGLMLCPSELAPRLFLSKEAEAVDWTRTRDSYISVAMDPIVEFVKVDAGIGSAPRSFEFLIEGSKLKELGRDLQPEVTTSGRGFIFALP